MKKKTDKIAKLKNIHPEEILQEEFLILCKYFGTSTRFWLGLQDNYDLEEEANTKQRSFNSIKSLHSNAA